MATRQDPPGPEPGDLRDRSLGELLKQLSEQTTRLVHQELELAKAELTRRAGRPGWAPGCSAARARSGWPPSAP
jgi:hypothetical protein